MTYDKEVDDWFRREANPPEFLFPIFTPEQREEINKGFVEYLKLKAQEEEKK